MSVIETLIVIGGVIGAAVVGLFVFTRNIHRWSNRIYGLMTLSFIILMIANLFTFGRLTDTSVVLWCIRIVAASTTAGIACLYFLTQVLAIESGTPHLSRKFNWLIVWWSVVTVCVNLTPLVFQSATLNEAGVHVSVSFGAAFFAIHALAVMSLTVAHLFVGLRKGSKRRRGQDVAILIGILPTLTIAPLTSFVLPVIYGMSSFVALSPLYIVFFIVMVAYAMIKHGLFNIRLAAVRTAAYVLTLITLAAGYVVLVYLLSALIVRNQTEETVALLNPIAIGSALFIAFAFQPIKKIFNKLTDNLFYKDNYSMGQFMAQINRTLNSTNDLRTLLERTSEVIASTLKSSQVFFFVNLPDERYMTAGTQRHSRVAPSEFIVDEAEIGNKTDMIIVSQLDMENHLRRMLVSHRIELIMPLRKSDVLVGYLCLGEPRNLGYTSRDIRALQTLSDEVTIAIQNALAVDEVRKLNDTLEQRVASATRELRASNAQLQRLDEAKDEFISMASHQLRTPLTSIKGYLSMLIEGDIGAVSNEQKHILNEAFISSERMVRLIGDFLNVSRLQTGKFVIEKHPVDLAQLVERELEALEANAAARQMKFVYKKPKNIPLLELDENKIEQVIMNFADNAIYYSKEHATITVTLKIVADFIELRVIDNGIGVPHEEQAQLFNKFFRATNARRARPDGTGVGLFLAKKVILEHGGSLIFESEEGKGSTFGFRLALPKE